MSKEKTTKRTGFEPMISPNTKPFDLPEEDFIDGLPLVCDDVTRALLARRRRRNQQRPGIWRVTRRPTKESR